MLAGVDDALFLVRVGDDPVEQPGPVDDNQIGSGKILQYGVGGAVAFGLARLEHEFGGLGGSARSCRDPLACLGRWLCGSCRVRYCSERRGRAPRQRSPGQAAALRHIRRPASRW